MFPDRYPADMVCGDDDDGTAASGADDVPLRRAAATSTGNSYKTGDKAFERSEKKTNTSPSSVNFGEDFLVRRATEIKKKKSARASFTVEITDGVNSLALSRRKLTRGRTGNFEEKNRGYRAKLLEKKTNPLLRWAKHGR